MMMFTQSTDSRATGRSWSTGLILLILGSILLIGCQPADVAPVTTSDPNVIVAQAPLEGNRLCTGRFFPRYLDFVTTNSYEPIDMYDSNGTGVAVNDLNGDGLNDLIFANLAGDNEIFWNRGDLRFESVAFPMGNSRGVATVDINADGLLDIIFTTRTGSLIYWRNTGDSQTDFPFEREPFDGISEMAYAMNWSDLDQDGDLDVVTGSYDTALEKELRDSFMMGDGAGVFVFENLGGRFEIQARLADASQALAVEIVDLNGDGLDDILIGNDFDSVEDMVWLASSDGEWIPAEPFEVTTQNTMSFDLGDVNNDGVEELFAADMHQYAFDEETNAAWEPVMEGMMDENPRPDNPQRMENMLHTPTEDGFTNIAPDSGIAYSGWSWSSRFGDLDQDGFLDLYIVNGMITADTFGHMPNFELVEENQAFRNLGDGRFEPYADWGLGATEGGRGMTMADLDRDGDLDIVINNLLDKAIVYENRVCSGHSLLVDLRESAGQNRFAVGSKVTLITEEGQQVREVRTVAGYLSAPPSQLHFGFKEGTDPINLIIEWSDGTTTQIDGLSPDQQLTITR